MPSKKFQENAANLIRECLEWWKVHQYDVDCREHGEYNLYDDDPNFVTIAKDLRSSGVRTQADVKSVNRLVDEIIIWYAEHEHDTVGDGTFNVFDEDPKFVRIARDIQSSLKNTHESRKDQNGPEI